jgi:hypothetical protein
MRVPGLFTKKRSKYGAVPTVVDGVRFASKAEFNRWYDLSMLERAGKISQLERQVVYELAPSVHIQGEPRRRPALRCIVDIRYFDIAKGHFVIEDTKGQDTPVSRIKRHLMKSIHGIDVVIT